MGFWAGWVPAAADAVPAAAAAWIAAWSRQTQLHLADVMQPETQLWLPEMSHPAG